MTNAISGAACLLALVTMVACGPVDDEPPQNAVPSAGSPIVTPHDGAAALRADGDDTAAATVLADPVVEQEPLPEPPPEPAPPAFSDVILLAGQSNALGVGTAPVDALPIPGVPFGVWSWDRWEGAPVHVATQRFDDLVVQQHYGPERGIAQVMLAAGRTLAVEKVAKGGAPITDFLPFAGGLLDTALQGVEAAYPGSRIHVVWVQGETEAYTTEEVALGYEPQLRELLSGIGKRADVFLVGIHRDFTACPYRAIVRAAQVKVCGELPSCRLINPDAIPNVYEHDSLHYNEALGQPHLGRMIGEAVLATK